MNEIQHRKLEGVVVSDKMKKTVVVAVERLKLNKKYKKQFKVTTKFKAHDENNEYHPGDKVIIEETRPISRDKRWRVVARTHITRPNDSQINSNNISPNY